MLRVPRPSGADPVCTTSIPCLLVLSASRGAAGRSFGRLMVCSGPVTINTALLDLSGRTKPILLLACCYPVFARPAVGLPLTSVNIRLSFRCVIFPYKIMIKIVFFNVVLLIISKSQGLWCGKSLPKGGRETPSESQPFHG